ncbi:eucalyptus isoform 2-T2 [Cochliomyia hominivorax]
MQSEQIIEKIRNKLTESDPANRTVMNIFQFHFTDSDGKLIKSVELNIYEGNCSEPDAEVTISDENFYLVGTKETTFDDLINDDKVKIEGDKEAFNKMVEKIRLMPKKE